MFFSCLLNTGIITPCMPWAQRSPNRAGCRAGAAQCDKALHSSKCGHPGYVSLPFQHPIAPWWMQKGLLFSSLSTSTSQRHLQHCDPISCPQGKQTNDFHTAHVCSLHSQSWCSHGGISSHKQLFKNLPLNGMQLSLLPLKNESKKDSMNLAGDHCKLDPVKNSVESGGHEKAKSWLKSHSLWPKYSAKILQMKKVSWLAVISPLWIEENLQWEKVY